ncbi:MAG: aspartate aminotransferase-like enzyme [Verrucomicrobiales bacterium]|jgi:aspartate aminotransferase-like enzyme
MPTAPLSKSTEVANTFVPSAAAIERKEWLFVPGPVPIEPHLRAIGEQQPPYNRTNPFSETTHEILSGLKYLFQTEGDVALLTGSGTAAMEASILNFLCPSDNALVINGGTFGKRWCDLCEVHSIPYEKEPVQLGEDVDLVRLESLLSSGRFSTLLINAHETSTGHLYDIQAVGSLARQHGVFLVVDAISSICADHFYMDAWNVDVAILSSQKALALPPGLSFVAMNERAIARLERSKPKTLYFNLRDYLDNQRRGQLPYTPAIGLMLQLHQRLLDIQKETLQEVVEAHRLRASYFRTAIEHLEFNSLPVRPSNAMTALTCATMDASNVVTELQNQYQMVVAPSGGVLKSKVIRIAHMGAQDHDDLRRLAAAFGEIAHAQ